VAQGDYESEAGTVSDRVISADGLEGGVNIVVSSGVVDAKEQADDNLAAGMRTIEKDIDESSDVVLCRLLFSSKTVALTPNPGNHYDATLRYVRWLSVTILNWKTILNYSSGITVSYTLFIPIDGSLINDKDDDD
jgi:hypothetical protein